MLKPINTVLDVHLPFMPVCHRNIPGEESFQKAKKVSLNTRDADFKLQLMHKSSNKIVFAHQQIIEQGHPLQFGNRIIFIMTSEKKELIKN